MDVLLETGNLAGKKRLREDLPMELQPQNVEDRTARFGQQTHTQKIDLQYMDLYRRSCINIM